MQDPRHQKLSNLLVNYSVNIQPGEKCLIEAYDTPLEFVESLVQTIYDAGGIPLMDIKYNRLTRKLLEKATAESLSVIAESELYRMKMMDAYIGVRGPANVKEMSDLPSEQTGLFNKEIIGKIHMAERVPNTKWVVLRYPTPAMAMMAQMSTVTLEDYYFDVTTGVDYQKMSKMMNPAVDFLANAKQVAIKGPGTDLTFSIEGIGAVKCDGTRNVPDGEVYSAPVRDSVNGILSYNAASSYNGFTFNQVKLTFKNGKIVEATANDTERINQIFDTDEGARYVGEFALGCNPNITFAMDETLFDEKIMGSFHFTPGNAYDETDNGNRSVIHWDLVCIQTPQYGGGEIWIDDECIRKDGIFLHPAFKGLNPESLTEK